MYGVTFTLNTGRESDTGEHAVQSRTEEDTRSKHTVVNTVKKYDMQLIG